MTHTYLATEDELSEAVGLKLLAEYLGVGDPTVLRRGGNGYLRSRVESFFQLAARNVVVVVTDLDSGRCPPTLIRKWFGATRALPERLIFRVAVREIESWLMADIDGFAALLGINPKKLNKNPDQLQDAKAELLTLAKKAARGIRADILPNRGSLARQGLGYNSVLTDFVWTKWDSARARSTSSSLDSACDRLSQARRFL